MTWTRGAGFPIIRWPSTRRFPPRRPITGLAIRPVERRDYEYLAVICSSIPATGIQAPGSGYSPPFHSLRCSSDRKRLFWPQVPPRWTTAVAGDTWVSFPRSASIKIRSAQWAQASSSLIRCSRYWLLTNSRKSMAQGMPKRSPPSNVTVWNEKPSPSRNLAWSSATV